MPSQHRPPANESLSQECPKRSFFMRLAHLQPATTTFTQTTPEGVQSGGDEEGDDDVDPFDVSSYFGSATITSTRWVVSVPRMLHRSEPAKRTRITARNENNLCLTCRPRRPIILLPPPNSTAQQIARSGDCQSVLEGRIPFPAKRLHQRNATTLPRSSRYPLCAG